jgi:pyridoxal phosphate enzyme (YggS family)
MSIAENLRKIKSSLPSHVALVIVTKTQPIDKLLEVYNAGHKIFGENKVQELLQKQPELPQDIQWHLIGHLQSNKVKYITPFVNLIQSVDSLKLLQEIDKQAKKQQRVIDCLLQIYIAKEESKFGLSFLEAEELIASNAFAQLNNIRITGFMGMATNFDETEKIFDEFNSLKSFYDRYHNVSKPNFQISILSMGMSSDYTIAVDCGSNMVRIGSSIFEKR